MSADTSLLDDLVRSILTDHAARREPDGGGRFAPALWDVLDECGLTTIGIPETAGGGGGTMQDVAVVLRGAGEFAAPVPIAEHLLGQLALHRSGLDLATGIVTFAIGDLAVDAVGDRWRVRGRAARVPYGRDASELVVVAADRADLARVSVGAIELVEGSDLAGEPRDDATFDLVVESDRVSSGVDAAALRRVADVFRSIQLAGAARGALDLALRHATDRTQFGRRLAAFQAIQHQLAVAVAEVELLEAAAAAAVAELQRGVDDEEAEVAALACKACAGRAAMAVAAIAHQVLGAIGFTREHELRLRTTRIWSWRAEFDADEWCERRLATLVTRPASDFWALITAS